jgi:hypothetical protein
MSASQNGMGFGVRLYASEQRHPSAVFDCVLNSEHA